MIRIKIDKVLSFIAATIFVGSIYGIILLIILLIIAIVRKILIGG